VRMTFVALLSFAEFGFSFGANDRIQSLMRARSKQPGACSQAILHNRGTVFGSRAIQDRVKHQGISWRLRCSN
jgi:hypothetical protein